MLSLSLAVLLHANPAQLIVWGGGKTPEAAQTSLAEWKKRSVELSEFVTLQPGFPKVVDSATVEGLNPGFHIVVLGACSDADTKARVDLLKLFEPAVYQKLVTWPDAASCPLLGSKEAPLEVSVPARIKTAGGELTALTVSSGGEDMWKTTTLTRFQMKGAAPVLQTFENDDCSPGALSSRAGGLAFESTCVTDRCTSWGHTEYRFTYTVKDGGVDEALRELRVLNKAQCD